MGYIFEADDFQVIERVHPRSIPHVDAVEP
jgi:hypothetical protein